MKHTASIGDKIRIVTTRTTGGKSYTIVVKKLLPGGKYSGEIANGPLAGYTVRGEMVLPSAESGIIVGHTDINGRKGERAIIGGKVWKVGGGEIIMSEKAATDNCAELSRMNVEAGSKAFSCDEQKVANVDRASGDMPRDEYHQEAAGGTKAGGTLIGSAGSKEALEKLINKYFYSTTYRIEDGKLYNSKGEFTRGRIEQKKGRWRFVMNEASAQSDSARIVNENAAELAALDFDDSTIVFDEKTKKNFYIKKTNGGQFIVEESGTLGKEYPSVITPNKQLPMSQSKEEIASNKTITKKERMIRLYRAGATRKEIMALAKANAGEVSNAIKAAAAADIKKRTDSAMRMWNKELSAASGAQIPDRYKAMGFTEVGHMMDSTNPEKKWMVLAKKGDHYKVVHGGQKGMEDFSQHKDEARRQRFWKRMGGEDSAQANDPFSPLYWHKKYGTWAGGGVAAPGTGPQHSREYVLLKMRADDAKTPEALAQLAEDIATQLAAGTITQADSDWLNYQIKQKQQSAEAGVKNESMKDGTRTFDPNNVYKKHSDWVIAIEDDNADINYDNNTEEGEMVPAKLTFSDEGEFLVARHLGEIVGKWNNGLQEGYVYYEPMEAASGTQPLKTTPMTAIWQEGLYYLKLHNIISEPRFNRHYKIIGYTKTELRFVSASDLTNAGSEHQIPYDLLVKKMDDKLVVIEGHAYENDRDKALLQNEINGIVKAHELEETSAGKAAAQQRAFEAEQNAAAERASSESQKTAFGDTIKGMEALSGGGQAPRLVTEKYSWGTLRKVEFGSDGRAVIHPKEWKSIIGLRPSQTFTYKDEQGIRWVVKKMYGDTYSFEARGAHGMSGKVVMVDGEAAAGGLAVRPGQEYLHQDFGIVTIKDIDGDIVEFYNKTGVLMYQSKSIFADKSTKKAATPKDGGSVPDQYTGKSDEEIWNDWRPNQRAHFVRDHKDQIPAAHTTDKAIATMKNWKFKDVPEPVKNALINHTLEGGYSGGKGPEKLLTKKEFAKKIGSKTNSAGFAASYREYKKLAATHRAELKDLDKAFGDIAKERKKTGNAAGGHEFKKPNTNAKFEWLVEDEDGKRRIIGTNLRRRPRQGRRYITTDEEGGKAIVVSKIIGSSPIAAGGAKMPRGERRKLLKLSKLSPEQFELVKDEPGAKAYFIWNKEEQLYVKKEMEV